ncbi:hypothetical protein ACFL5A_02165 [Gemmatimonadota bacterium]
MTIVSNADLGVWAAGEEWTFVEELRIGVQEGSPEYQFGNIQDVTVDSNGRIFALDGIARHIQVYSSDGVYEQTLGAEGSGPGELRSGAALLMGQGDTLLVPDRQLLRFNRYGPDGSTLGSFPMMLEEGSPWAFEATPSGLAGVQIRLLGLPGQVTAGEPRDFIVLLSTEGMITDTLLSYPIGHFFRLDGHEWYAPEPTWDVTEDSHLVIGWPDEYRIEFYAGGNLTRIVTKPFQPRPITDRAIERVLGEMDRRADELGLSLETRAQVRDRTFFADSVPAFETLVVGPIGTIWVKRIKPPLELLPGELRLFPENPERTWDVFDSAGRYLGLVTLPDRFDPMVFRADRVFGRWRDELDVPYVMELRIVGDLSGNLD